MSRKKIFYAKVIIGQCFAIVFGFLLLYRTTYAFPNQFNILAVQSLIKPSITFSISPFPSIFVSTKFPPTATPKPTLTPTLTPTRIPTRPPAGGPTKVPTLAPTNPPPKPTTQPIAPTANQAPPQTSGAGLTGIEQEMVTLINQKRGGLPQLSVNAQLTEAARRESRDNSKRGSVGDCSHTGTDGSNFTTRAHDAGYSGFAYGETIGCGHQSAQAIVDAWWASPGHHDILNNGEITMIGVGWESGNFTAQTAVVGR